MTDKNYKLRAFLKGTYYAIFRNPLSLASLILIMTGVVMQIFQDASGLNDSILPLALIFAGIALAALHVFWNRN